MFLYHALKNLLSPPHPDKVLDTMPHALHEPSKKMFPILHNHSFADTIPYTITTIKEQIVFDAHTARDLEALSVTEIGQYRKEKGPHEVIVIQYAYQPDKTKLPLSVDKRAARFERLKGGSHTSSKSESSPECVRDVLEGILNRQRADHVSISHQVKTERNSDAGLVSASYSSIRSFLPPPGSLNFLQVLIIANAVSSAASEYSTLQHMCLWFATSLYVSIKQYISFNGLDNVSGQFSKLGTAMGIRLVDRHTGALTLGTVSLKDLYANVFAQGDASHEDIEELLKAVEKEENLLRDQGKLQLLQVSSIIRVARMQQDKLYGFLREKSQTVKDRLEEEERKREADRKRLEVAEAGQVVEHRRAEEEHRRAEEERKRAEEECKRAEEECKRAEEERKRAKDERARADAAEAGQAAALAQIASLRLLLENQKKQ